MTPRVVDVEPSDRRQRSVQDTIDKINASKLSAPDKAKISRLLILLDKPSADLTGFGLRLAREAAGLTLGQASELVEISSLTLLNLEKGEWDGNKFPAWAARFDEVYGLGVK